MTDSTVEGNRITDLSGVDHTPYSAMGGGIASIGPLATIHRSTVSGNDAKMGGGLGIWRGLHLINSTVSGNSAGWGAGLRLSSRTALTLIEFSTIAANTARIRGGGILWAGVPDSEPAPRPTHLRGSIVAAILRRTARSNGTSRPGCRSSAATWKTATPVGSCSPPTWSTPSPC